MDLRSRLTFANVCSFSALVMALGCGSAYAADLVGTSQLRNGAVTTAKLAPGAVTGAKVEKKSLGPGVFAPGTLRRGPRGPAGPAGPRTRVIDVTYPVDLTKADDRAALTYPIPEGSWLATTSVSVGSAAVGTGDHLLVHCSGPRDRHGGRGRVFMDATDLSLVSTWTTVSALVSTGASPEPTIWECDLNAQNGVSAVRLEITTLLQPVGGFD